LATIPRICADPYHRRTSLPNEPRARQGGSRRFLRTALGSSASARARSCGAARTDLVEQPGAGEADVAVDGCGRCAGSLGDLFVRQAAEIMQFDDLCEASFEPHEALQGIVERDDAEMGGRQPARVG